MVSLHSDTVLYVYIRLPSGLCTFIGECNFQAKTSAVGSSLVPRPFFSPIERWVEKRAWYLLHG